MTTMTIKVPGKAKEKLSAFLKELGGEIVPAPLKKDLKKDRLINDIRQGLKEVKEIEAGRAKFYTVKDLLDGE